MTSIVNINQRRPRRRGLSLLTQGAALCATLGVGLIASQALQAALPPPTITAYQEIQLPSDGRLTDGWQVQVDGTTLKLQAKANLPLLARLPGTLRQTLSDKAFFYRGQIQEEAGSWLRLSWVDGQWSGGWYSAGQLYLVDEVDNVRGFLSSPPRADIQTLVYRLDDLVLPFLEDAPAVEPNRGNSADFVSHLRRLSGVTASGREGATRGAGGLQQLPLTIVSDTQFTAINGANTSANVVARINFTDGIYSDQLGVSLGILHHEILTNNGTLLSTDSSVLLDQFRAYMTTGAGGSLPRGGISHLFTGRNINGNIVGRAYLGVICNIGFGYGFDQDFNGNTLSALIFAHELGHNFGAPHDGEDACINEPFRGIMNPVINGTTEFSQCSIQEMSDDIAAANCFVNLPQLIYQTGFEQP